MDDDDVLRGLYAAAELREHTCERVPGIGASHGLWRDVARPAEHVVRLVEAELADVAGDRRLGHAAAGPGQRVEELVLCPHPPARDDARNQLLTLVFLERTRLSLHTRKNKYATFRRLAKPASRYASIVLRKLMWTGLYASLAAVATLAARKTASAIWRVATGEEPPSKK